MGKKTDTRQRMIEQADTLFRRHGYLNTALLQVVEESGASRGSIYFHFPGGKEELGVEVMGRVHQTLVDTVDEAAKAGDGDPGEVVLGMAREFGETLRDTGYQSGCPIVPVALEAVPASEPLREACADVFGAWERQVAMHFESAGLGAEEAHRFARLAVCALEGGLVLARTQQSLEPLDQVALDVAEQVRKAVLAQAA